MRSSLPDDAQWIWAKKPGVLVDPDGSRDVLGGSAVLPPSEVLAIFNLIDYLSEQIARCNAAVTPR